MRATVKEADKGKRRWARGEARWEPNRGGPAYFACLAWLLVATGLAAADDRPPAALPQTVEVFYPGTGCDSRVLEVEAWAEDRESWDPHPVHPRVVADSCVAENATTLLHQIRIRCIDPAQRKAPSPWRVGLGLAAGVENRCEDRKPDSDGAGILVSQPAADSEVVNEAGRVTVAGRVGFEERESIGYEIVVVIDISGSTAQPSGIDVDADGILGVPLGREPAIFSSDRGDSILAAEIQAVRLLLARMAKSLGPTRIALVSFSGEMVVGEGGGAYSKQPAVRVEVPLSADGQELSVGLDRIMQRGPAGGSNFFAAVERSLLELSGHWSAQSDARSDARKVIVLLTDGVPSPPPPGSAYADPASRARAVLATRGAEDAGVAIHIYALGGRADEFPRFVRTLLHGSAGSFTRVRDPGDTALFLGELTFSELSEVSIQNLTAQANSEDVRLTPDGHFQGSVPVTPGTNALRVTARTADGQERRREFRFRYVRPSDRAKFLEDERARIEGLRERRKDVRIEPATNSSAGEPDPSESDSAPQAPQEER